MHHYAYRINNLIKYAIFARTELVILCKKIQWILWLVKMILRATKYSVTSRRSQCMVGRKRLPPIHLENPQRLCDSTEAHPRFKGPLPVTSSHLNALFSGPLPSGGTMPGEVASKCQPVEPDMSKWRPEASVPGASWESPYGGTPRYNM